MNGPDGRGLREKICAYDCPFLPLWLANTDLVEQVSSQELGVCWLQVLGLFNAPSGSNTLILYTRMTSIDVINL